MGHVNDQDYVEIRAGVAKGMRLRSASGRHYVDGQWDRMFQALMQELLHGGGVFYDVGAHVGFHTMVAAKLVGSEGFVYAFEALPENWRELRENIDVNRLVNCSAVNCAVGNFVGPVEFFRHREANTLGSTTPVPPESEFERIEVESLSLDLFSQAARPPDLVKIDVEGAEALVVTGASALMTSAHPPVFLIELHTPESAKETLRILTERDYLYGGFDADLEIGTLNPITRIAHIVAMRRDDPRCMQILEEEPSG